jgi:WD40 repeat protein
MESVPEGIRRAALSADGAKCLAVTGREDQTVHVWSNGGGRRLSVLGGHTGPVRAAFFSPDGRRVLTVDNGSYFDPGGGAPPVFRIWDAERGELLASYPLEPGDVRSDAWMSADSRAMVYSPGSWSPEYALYRRRRPEWWWGVFWLWEFWLTAAFAGALAWSVVADRRALRRMAGSGG